MKIFLSWSGENSQSHKVAQALHNWLPRVIQQAKPWLSSHDMDSGINWGPEVDKQLSEIHFGILVITRDSMLAPWLLFEAGALSKHVERSYVCPYLCGLTATDMEGPLTKLMSRESNEKGTLMLLETINNALPDANTLAADALKEQFEMWWPKLKEELDEIENNELKRCDSELTNIRDDRELLEEILTLARNIPTLGRQVPRGSYNSKSANNDSVILQEIEKEYVAEVNFCLEKVSIQELKVEKAKTAGEPTADLINELQALFDSFKIAQMKLNSFRAKTSPYAREYA